MNDTQKMTGKVNAQMMTVGLCVGMVMFLGLVIGVVRYARKGEFCNCTIPEAGSR